MKSPVVTFIALIICSGCIAQSAPITQPAITEQPIIAGTTTLTMEPTEEPTFISPDYRHRQYLEFTTEPTTAAGPDPAIGTWSLKGLSYPGSATVSADGQGSLIVKISCLSKTIPFAWANKGKDAAGNTKYHIALADGSGTAGEAVIDSNGILTSEVLPEGAYLQKEVTS